MIFKLSYNNQTHLYNKTPSIQTLNSYCSKVFRNLPECFTFIYMSPKGEMVYVESDADLIGLKYCCSSSNDMIVKLNIIKTQKFQHFDIDEDIQTINIVKQNLEEINENIFTKLQDQSHIEAVSQYLSETYEKVSSEIIEQQKTMARKEVNQYLSNLYENSSKIISEKQHPFIVERPRKTKAVRFSPEKPIIIKIEKSMEEMVNEKVVGLIPSLVEKIYKKMELKLKKGCKSCIRRQIDIECAIDEEINRKLSSISFESQNPEEQN